MKYWQGGSFVLDELFFRMDGAIICHIVRYQMQFADCYRLQVDQSRDAASNDVKLMFRQGETKPTQAAPSLISHNHS